MSAPALPVKALVVDDDPVIQSLLCAFLRSRGYAVDAASDGRSGLARLAGASYNLVITDRNMPEMDGLAFCRAIRALATPAYVYCIMLTSSADEGTLVAAMEAGVDDFVGKPLRPAELGARLRAAERVLALEAGLARRNGELASALGQLNSELELARSLQLGQLPPPASVGPLRFEWLFEACSYVGGDMFDYFVLDDRHVGFYVADVSGHGVAAAMMAFNARHQLLACSQAVLAQERHSEDVARIAQAIVTDYNARVLQMQDTSLYLTLAFGIADLDNSRVGLVHAGHPPCLFAPSKAAPLQEVGEPSVPLGILAEPGYEGQTLALAPGSRLVLYSDGITDCRNGQDEPFGAGRLRQALSGRGSLAQDCSALRDSLLAWRAGPFEDDVTALALELR